MRGPVDRVLVVILMNVEIGHPNGHGLTRFHPASSVNARETTIESNCTMASQSAGVLGEELQMSAPAAPRFWLCTECATACLVGCAFPTAAVVHLSCHRVPNSVGFQT